MFESKLENLKKTACDGNCGSCGQSSDTCGQSPESMLEECNAASDIKKVIAVVSGKGGVGKSMVTSLLATTMRRRGHKVAIMDADVTGPSIPKEFGVTEMAVADDDGIIPIETSTGIKTISVNNLLENETDPVLWRGPVIAGLVKQFWTDVAWGDVDYMFVDMPPGTGDVPLTVFQSLPVDGIIVVTSPQDLVNMVVAKAINMAAMMNIPVIGLVENYSYYKCEECGTEVQIFGPSKVDQAAKDFGVEVLAKLPIEPKLAAICDQGKIESFEGAWIDEAASKIEAMD